MKAGASVIICCYNSEERIEEVLFHLDKQKETVSFHWEIIVVDNASTDNTAEVAKKSWNRKDIELKVVFEGNPGLTNARLKGLSTANYEIIIFIDDDNLVSDTYISRAFKIMLQHEEVGLAGGLGLPVTLKPLPHWFEAFQGAYAVGEQTDKKGYLPLSKTYLHGAGLIMRKSIWDFLQSKGFSLLLSGRTGKSLGSGEDSEISTAFRLAGYKLWYDPNLKFKHVLPDQRLNWKYVIRLAREFGKSFVILDIYQTEILRFTGWNRLKSHNWLISVLICVKILITNLPSYLYLRLNNIEGNRKEFTFNYQFGALTQRLRLIGRFNAIKKEITTLRKNLDYDKNSNPA